MDKLGFLDGAEAPKEEVAPEAEAPAPAAAEAETPEQKESRERDERGRFKAKEEAQPQPEAPAAQPAPVAEPTPQVPDGYVPVGVVKELREELRALKTPQQPIPTPQPPAPPPDMFEDPEGYRNWTQSQIVNVQLNISEEMTRSQYGDELVDAARDWAMEQFQARPGFAQEVFSQRNPYSYAVKAYQKSQSLAQLGDDPKEIQAYLAWKQAQSAQPVAQPPPQQQQRPPQSIASAPSAGGQQHQAIGPGVAFDDTIR